MLRAIGLECTEAEVADMIGVVDVDGSSTLDFPEFVNLMTSRYVRGSALWPWSPQRHTSPWPRLCRLKDTDIDAEEAAAFSRFDKDGSGGISVEDLRKVLCDVCRALHARVRDCMLEVSHRARVGV